MELFIGQQAYEKVLNLVSNNENEMFRSQRGTFRYSSDWLKWASLTILSIEEDVERGELLHCSWDFMLVPPL